MSGLDAKQQAAAQRWAKRRQNAPTNERDNARGYNHSPNHDKENKMERSHGPEDDIEP